MSAAAPSSPTTPAVAAGTTSNTNKPSSPKSSSSNADGGSNVRVSVRVRPFNKRELDISKKAGQEVPDSVINMRGNTCVVLEHFRDEKGFAQTKEREAFSFDECFWSMLPGQGESDNPFADNKYVYERSGLVALNNAFDGYNSCVFCYGQTGSGKTWTMSGAPDEPGIAPRISEDIFNRIAAQAVSNPTTKCIVECMYYEVYNEKVRDLFKKEAKPGEHEAPRIRQHPTKGTYVEGLNRKETKTGEETKNLIEKGSKERAMSSTKMNAQSSRSHSIFQIQLTQNSASTGTSRVSTINLVDLAGSEKVRDSGVTGEGFQEAKNINQSLSTLRKVIDCLIDNSSITNPKKKKVPPFRESVLTYVLSDSLGGNSRTMMMSAVSPHEVNTEDTLNTLRYALRAKAIVCNATVNEEKSAKMMDAMKDELRKLKEALASGNIAAAGGGVDAGGRPMMPEEIKQEIAQREAEMNKMEKQQEELTQLLEDSKKREEEVQQQLAEVAEQRAALDIEIEQKKREQFASAFRSAFLITKDKKKHADQQKDLDEARQGRLDAEEQTERTKKQLEEVKKETREKVALLEKELTESEEKLKQLYQENKEEREKLRTTLQNKVSSLESEVATNKEIIEQITKESEDELAQLKNRLRGQIVQLEKDMAATKSEAEEKEKDLKSQLERQQRLASERLAETEQKVNEMMSENQKLRTDARSARDAARDQSQELHKQISALQLKLEEAQDEKELEVKNINDQHARKTQQLNTKVSDLEKQLAVTVEKSVKQDRLHRENEEKLKKNHSQELSSLTQKLEEEIKRAQQQLNDANQQQHRLKNEIEDLTNEHERNIEFERNLKEEAVREIKSSSERAKSQLSRRVAELEIELQTEKAASEQSLLAAKSSAKAEVDTMESEIESLRHQLKSAENRIDTLKSEKEELSKELKELSSSSSNNNNNDNNNSSIMNNEEVQSKISSLEQQLREAKENEKRAQSQLSFRTTQFEAEVKELGELNEEIRRDSKKFLDSQIAELQSRIADSQSQSDVERSKHREALLSRDRQISDKTSRIADLERELNSLKDSKSSLENELRSTKQSLEQQRKESQQRITELTAELQSTKQYRSDDDTKLLESQKSLRTQIAKVAELEQQIQSLQAAIDKKEYSLNQLEDRLKQEHLTEVTELKSELQMSEEQRNSAEAELRVVQGKLSAQSRSDSDLRATIDDLTAKNKQLHDQISSGQEKVVSDLRQNISQQQTEAAALRKELEESSDSNKQQLQAKEAKITELMNEISFVRHTLSLHEAESARRLNLVESNSQAKLSSISSEIRVLTESLHSAEKSARAAKSENTILSEKISQLEKSLENERTLRSAEVESAAAASNQVTENMREKFQQQKQLLEQEIDEMKKSLADAEQEKKRRLEEQSSVHEGELFNIKQQLSIANTERDAAEDKLIEAQRHAERVLELENQVLELEASKETLSTGHSAELSRLALQLQVAENQVKHQQSQIELLHQQKQQQQQQFTSSSVPSEENLDDQESTAIINDDQEGSPSPAKKRSIARTTSSPSPATRTSALHQQRITQLEHSLDEAQQNLRKSQAEYSLQLEQQRNRYQEQVSRLQSEISSLQQLRETESRSFKEKLRTISDEHRAMMEKESASAKNTLATALRTAKSNQEATERSLKAKISELELECAQAQRDVALSTAKIDSLQQNVHRSNQRAAVAEDKLAAIKQDHDNMNAEVASLRHARDDLVHTHQSSINELNLQLQKQESAHRVAMDDLKSEHESQSQHSNAKIQSLEQALKTAHDNLESARRDSRTSLERFKALSEARIQELEEQVAERNSALHRAQLEHSNAIKSLEETYHNKLREVRDNALTMRSATSNHTEANALAEMEAQCRTLQLAAEQARQARDASERQLAREQSRIVALEAEISANGMKREMVEADFESLKSAHAKQLSQLQSANATLEGESSALRQALDRLHREVAAEHDQVHEAAEKCKELGHKLHMAEIKYREASDTLGSERVAHEQKIGDVERRLQEAIFEKDRMERSLQDEMNRVKQQADRRVHELEVALINATNTIHDEDEDGLSGSSPSPSRSSVTNKTKEIERLKDLNSHQQIRISELEKEVNLAKASAVRAEQDFDEAYERIKDQSNKKVKDLEKELSTLRQSLHQTQRDSKEAIEKQNNSSEQRFSDLQHQLQQAMSQQLTIREEAKVTHDRLIRQHEVQVSELEQKISTANAAADSANSDLAVSQMLKTQAERRIGELENEIKRLNDEIERHREDHKSAVDRLQILHKTELSDLEKQLEKEKLHGVSSTKELSAQRDRLSSSMQSRVQELERMLQQANDSRTSLQNELESLRRSRDQQKVSLETKLSDLQNQLSLKDDTATRIQNEYKDQMERLKSHHQLSILEAEKRSPSSKHLEALKDMEARVKAKEKSFEEKERSLRTTFEQELTMRFAKEQQLENENQNLRVAIQQLKSASNDTKRKLATFERESRISGMNNNGLMMNTNSSYSSSSLSNSNHNNNHRPSSTSTSLTKSYHEDVNEMSALDAAKERARLAATTTTSGRTSPIQQQQQQQQQSYYSVRNLSGQTVSQHQQQQRYNPNNSYHNNNHSHDESNNQQSRHQMVPVEISHLFTHQMMKRRSQTPNSTKPKKPFTLL